MAFILSHLSTLSHLVDHLNTENAIVSLKLEGQDDFSTKTDIITQTDISEDSKFVRLPTKPIHFRFLNSSGHHVHFLCFYAKASTSPVKFEVEYTMSGAKNKVNDKVIKPKEAGYFYIPISKPTAISFSLNCSASHGLEVKSLCVLHEPPLNITSLGDDLLTLLNGGTGDVTLKCHDGELRAHSFILQARCPRLKAGPVVSINGPTVLVQQLLHFLYTADSRPLIAGFKHAGFTLDAFRTVSTAIHSLGSPALNGVQEAFFGLLLQATPIDSELICWAHAEAPELVPVICATLITHPTELAAIRSAGLPGAILAHLMTALLSARRKEGTPTSLKGHAIIADTQLYEGARVRVMASISNPRYGWGSVTHDSVGTIRSLAAGGDCRVDFPGHSNWSGLQSEMELIDVEVIVDADEESSQTDI